MCEKAKKDVVKISSVCFVRYEIQIYGSRNIIDPRVSIVQSLLSIPADSVQALQRYMITDIVLWWKVVLNP